MKLKRSWSSMKIAIFSAILLALIAQPIVAQSQNISGSVVDASGGIVPGAAVKITDVAKGGTARQTSTDNAGRFQAMDTSSAATQSILGTWFTIRVTRLDSNPISASRWTTCRVSLTAAKSKVVISNRSVRSARRLAVNGLSRPRSSTSQG